MAARFTIGDAARLCRVPVRRIDGWIDQGFLRAQQAGHGPGYYRFLGDHELAIARRVAHVTKYYGVVATRALFARVRREEAPHGSERDDHDRRPDQRTAVGK
jgi:DNA-binding transcriptional MerR regulator